MSGLKYALGMLALGGVAGGASAASAATTIEYEPGFGLSSLTFEGALNPQYSYIANETKTWLMPQDGGYTGLITDQSGMPDAGEVFTTNSVKFNRSPVIPPDSARSAFGATADAAANDTYVHLAFNANGGSYIGFARYDGNFDLRSVTYEAGEFLVAGVPEPASWALLITGFGLAGAAVRRRRQFASA